MGHRNMPFFDAHFANSIAALSVRRPLRPAHELTAKWAFVPTWSRAPSQCRRQRLRDFPKPVMPTSNAFPTSAIKGKL